MVKIELSKGTKKEIEKQHKEYVQVTALARLEKMIEDDEGKGEILKKLFGTTKCERRKTVVKFCISDDLETLREIFLSKFKKIFKFDYEKTEKGYQRDNVKKINEILNNIFNYTEFNRGVVLKNGVKWNRHHFITTLNVKVCPYCNRQYVTSYEESKTTADADHYYGKAKYPILQLNIYNMVPSCNVCNSKTKGQKEKRHLYPYRDSSDSLTFRVPLEVGDKVSKIEIDTKDNKKAEASVEVFKLDKIYQAHLKEASEVKKHIYQYQEYKEEVYKNEFGLDIPFSIQDAWFDFMRKEISDEPLIKLKQDIYKQYEADM